MHQKKTFTDLQGNEIFTLGKKTFAMFKSFEGESPAGHNFEIKGNFSVGSSKSTITFVNAADKTPIELNLKGDWFDRSANITIGDRPVASINRSFGNAREIFGSKQTVSRHILQIWRQHADGWQYFVTIAPGVDMSLIAAICVALDERENEN